MCALLASESKLSVTMLDDGCWDCVWGCQNSSGGRGQVEDRRELQVIWEQSFLKGEVARASCTSELTSYASKAGDRGQSTSVNRLTKTTFGVIYNPETVSPPRSLGRKLGQVALWPSTFDEPVQSGVCVYFSSRRHSHDVCFAEDFDGGGCFQAGPSLSSFGNQPQWFEHASGRLA